MWKDKLPKLVLSDVDGVWTNGCMYYSERGEILKRFTTKDSLGVLLCRLHNIPVGIISGDESKATLQRAKKLGITIAFTGVRNKLKCANQIRQQLQLSWNEIAYIGDDWVDLPLLKKVGHPGCVPNAPETIKTIPGIYITQTPGGEGAFTEFVIHLFKKAQYWTTAQKTLLQYYTCSE